MTDDDALWERAWTQRDPDFDGRFFVCVRSTGVYCRCVCPVRLPHRRNVTFLRSAAAAEAAGFRPCLRCRPESAPLSPAWKGTRASVERAFRLIVEEGSLDSEGASVARLADRLGMTERHLRRLFAKHLGATPLAVARTARVQRAKRLLSGTDLPMTEIALRAGFGSLRRFNAVFAEVYRRPPGAIRRAGPGHGADDLAGVPTNPPRGVAPERRSPDIGGGRSATDVLLANPVRSGRKQP